MESGGSTARPGCPIRETRTEKRDSRSERHRRSRIKARPGLDGNLAEDECLLPQERIGVRDALYAYSRGAAIAAGLQGRLGRISCGFLADLTAFDRDLLSCDAEEILETGIALTVVDGQVVFKGSDF